MSRGVETVADEGEGGKGFGEEAAEEGVVAQMGSVVEVGAKNSGDRVGGGRWIRREIWALCSFGSFWFQQVYITMFTVVD